jgi:hypothetical protein
MSNLLMLLSIGLPWLGAIVIWLLGEKQRKTQHLLATVFSVTAGMASIFL